MPRAAAEIVREIGPIFQKCVDAYDVKKYPGAVSSRLRVQFKQPAQIKAQDIDDALRWKYGHEGKATIPSAHMRLIASIQEKWSGLGWHDASSPEAAFATLDLAFDGRTRFITVAFLAHLIHPTKLPIIDQHNFRAMNRLADWSGKKKPSTFDDIRRLHQFTDDVLSSWRRTTAGAPSRRDFDKFLMMYGKQLKANA